MKLPKITAKQTDILKLLYSYRFLNRIQIQTLMKHKDKKTINVWLRDLKAKDYIKWIYSTNFLDKTKPAIYYLGINGIRLLKTTDEYPIEQLRKRYREAERSIGFRNRSILIAASCLSLQAKNSSKLHYYCYTQADYIDPQHDYHFLAELETMRPSLCIIKQEHITQHKSSVKEPTTTNYLLEIFDSTLPRYRVKKRVKDYVDYLINDDWDSGDNDPPPIILLAVPTLTDLIYAKRRIKKIYEIEGLDYDDIRDMHIRFTTTDRLMQYSITANIWEERRGLFNV